MREVQIRDASAISGLSRVQINHLVSAYGFALSSTERRGEARRFSETDLMRLALAERLARVGIPWPVVVSIDAEMPMAAYDNHEAWLLAGWMNGHPDPELVRVVTPDGARRAMSSNGLHTGVVVNLTEIEQHVRTRLEPRQ